MLQFVVCGLRATGKSELIENILQTYGDAISLKKISAGQFVRDLATQLNTDLASADRHMLKNIELHRELDSNVLQQCLAAQNFVVDWRMGPMFRRQLPNAIMVRLDCDKTKRTIRYQKRAGILYYGLAEESLRAEETPYFEAMRELYGPAGVFADSDFDLVVDTSELTPEEVFAQVRRLITDRVPGLSRV
jgi:cytidylate kinase